MKTKKLAKAMEAENKARCAKNRAIKRAEERGLKIKKMDSALKIIYTWASVGGALNAKHVMDLIDKTLVDGKE